MKTINVTIADTTHEKIIGLKRRWKLTNIAEVITKTIDVAAKQEKLEVE